MQPMLPTIAIDSVIAESLRSCRTLLGTRGDSDVSQNQRLWKDRGRLCDQQRWEQQESEN
jgi:hypothetical protein